MQRIVNEWTTHLDILLKVIQKIIMQAVTPTAAATTVRTEASHDGPNVTAFPVVIAVKIRVR